jgi:hypothetical protein
MADESSGGEAGSDLEELKQRHQKGSRVSGAAAQGQRGEGGADEPEEDVDPLEAAIGRALERAEAGDASKSLSLRDAQLAALIQGLEEQQKDFTAVGVALQEALGRETDPGAIDRSEVLRLAIRVGLREAAPEAVEAAREAHIRRVSEQF